jgi:methionine sulfoxide reductase heme-binding subunit
MKWQPIVAALWAASSLALLLGPSGDADAYSAAVASTRALGYQAFVFLSAALCVSPLRRWLPHSTTLRRALGLASAGSALLHVAIAVATSTISLGEQLADPQLRFGIGSFAVLLLLAITSFPAAVRALGLRSWKELHRLAYVAWVCALLHGLLSPYAWLSALVGIAAPVLVLAWLRLLPKRREVDPVRDPRASS